MDLKKINESLKELSSILQEATPEEKKAKKEMEDLHKDLGKITSILIGAGNELRKLTSVRGKDMSQWRNQKYITNDMVKKWVDQLHQMGFINAGLDKTTTELMNIEKEIEQEIKMLSK
jgi:predicted Zn-dependent protease